MIIDHTRNWSNEIRRAERIAEVMRSPQYIELPDTNYVAARLRLENSSDLALYEEWKRVTYGDLPHVET